MTAPPPRTHLPPPDQLDRTLGDTRVVPVVVLDDPDLAPALGAALLAGGLTCVEVTLRTDAALAGITAMAANPALTVGAGTVLSPADADRAIAAGAGFLVSPGFSAPLVRHCRERDVPLLPGTATATDLQRAWEAGVRTVKFFPAQHLGGPTMISALAAPFRSMRFVPTGGVSTDNLADYLAVPAVLAVGGTWMVAPDLLAARDWPEVTRRAAAAVAAAGTARPRQGASA